MQRILLVLATGAFATLATATAARAAIVTNTSIPFTNFTAFVPCANGGAGEMIVGVGGELHILAVVTAVSGNAVFLKGHAQPQGASAVGVNTGDIYRATGVTQNQSAFSLQNGQQSITYVNNFRMIGPGPGNNFLVHETFHVTVTAKGDTTVVHDNFSIECK